MLLHKIASKSILFERKKDVFVNFVTFLNLFFVIPRSESSGTYNLIL